MTTPTLNCKNQTVFIGDNLPIMRGLNSGIADLIAADPPPPEERKKSKKKISKKQTSMKLKTDRL